MSGVSLFVASFSERGAELSERVFSFFEPVRSYSVYSPREKHRTSLGAFVGGAFSEALSGSPAVLVFVGALGICVRSIAPFLRHKFTDPSVLCVDEMSNFVVPVVGGHARLSNETARGLASRLGAVPVVTTASDVSGAFAIDSWALGASFDLRSVLPRTPSWNPEGRANDFSVLSENELEALSLFVRRVNSRSVGGEKVLSLGVGCRRGVGAEKLLSFVSETLAALSIPLSAVGAVSSIDLKRDERAVISLSERLGARSEFFSSEFLSSVSAKNSPFSASRFVLEKTGVGCVCERAAVASSMERVLVVKKISLDGMTLALAV